MLLDQKQGSMRRNMMVTKCDEHLKGNSAGPGAGMGWGCRGGF